MTHQDAGHYAAKHPKGTRIDPQIKASLQKKIIEGKVSCAAAHAIADELGRTPEEVGTTIDLMEARIHKCQLGLFGYQPQKRMVAPAATPSPEIEAAVRAHLVDGRIACKKCWEIAAQLGRKKMAVASVCETLRIKIKPCQLGAF